VTCVTCPYGRVAVTTVPLPLCALCAAACYQILSDVVAAHPGPLVETWTTSPRVKGPWRNPHRRPRGSVHPPNCARCGTTDAAKFMPSSPYRCRACVADYLATKRAAA
jgi:hypothetical protein